MGTLSYYLVGQDLDQFGKSRMVVPPASSGRSQIYATGYKIESLELYMKQRYQKAFAFQVTAKVGSGGGIKPKLRYEERVKLTYTNPFEVVSENKVSSPAEINKLAVSTSTINEHPSVKVDKCRYTPTRYTYHQDTSGSPTKKFKRTETLVGVTNPSEYNITAPKITTRSEWSKQTNDSKFGYQADVHVKEYRRIQVNHGIDNTITYKQHKIPLFYNTIHKEHHRTGGNKQSVDNIDLENVKVTPIVPSKPPVRVTEVVDTATAGGVDMKGDVGISPVDITISTIPATDLIVEAKTVTSLPKEVDKPNTTKSSITYAKPLEFVTSVTRQYGKAIDSYVSSIIRYTDLHLSATSSNYKMRQSVNLNSNSFEHIELAVWHNPVEDLTNVAPDEIIALKDIAQANSLNTFIMQQWHYAQFVYLYLSLSSPPLVPFMFTYDHVDPLIVLSENCVTQPIQTNDTDTKKPILGSFKLMQNNFTFSTLSDTMALPYLQQEYLIPKPLGDNVYRFSTARNLGDRFDFEFQFTTLDEKPFPLVNFYAANFRITLFLLQT